MIKHKNQQLKIGALIAYFTIGFNIIAGIIYTPWMIEQIGKSDYGLYTLASSIISLLLIDFGLSSATSRFIAAYRAKNDNEAIERFLSAVYKLYLLIDAIIFLVFIVVYCFSGLIYSRLSLEELEKFRTVFCIAGIYSVIGFPCITFNGILTAYEKFIPLKLSDLIQKMFTVVFTVVALLLGMRLYALVTVNAVCGLLSIVFKYIYVRKSVRIKLVKNERHTYKEIFSFSIWSTVWSLMQRLVFNITPTILGIVSAGATGDIAVFGIITTIEGYFHTVTSALNGMFIGRITRITSQESDGSQLTELAIKVGRFQFGLNSLILLGFIFVGKEFIHIWVGDSYAVAYYCILMVIIPGLFYNSQQIFHTAMVAENYVKYQAYVQILTGVCNISLSVVFSHFWGVFGASLSICIAYFVRIIATLILINKKLNVNLFKYIKHCYLKMSMPLLLSFVVCWIGVRYLSAHNWITLGIKSIAIVAIYAVLLFVFGFSREEKQTLKSKILNISK